MEEFKNRILTCVDRGLDHLGETVKYVIYWHLEHKFGLRKDKIPDSPEEFIKGLEEIYGMGTIIIEKNIVREINKEFGIKADDFLEAVKKAKKAGR